MLPFVVVALRHDNLETSPASPPRTGTTSNSITTPPRRTFIPTSPAKLDLASLASPQRNLEDDTPIEPPAQPFSFPPVDVPDVIPEVDEEKANDNDQDQDPEPFRDEVDQQAGPASPRPKIYSRVPADPVYSPTLRNATDGSISESPRRNGWRSNQDAASASPTAQPLTPTATGFGKRIVPMSTGGQIVAIPGPYSPKRITQTFTGSDASPTWIRPNFTGQSLPSGSPKRLAPNFTGGSWSPAAVAAQRVECPRCGKAVYHAEQVSWSNFLFKLGLIGHR